MEKTEIGVMVHNPKTHLGEIDTKGKNQGLWFLHVNKLLNQTTSLADIHKEKHIKGMDWCQADCYIPHFYSVTDKSEQNLKRKLMMNLIF